MEGGEFYKRFFGIDSPFDHQIEMWNKFNEGKFPLLLRAPTGSGKTEAILAPFLAQFVNGQFIAPRLIWVLPTRALINQLTKRISNYAKKVSSNIKVAAQHGETQDAPWFFADIVVTTLDQLIYGYARVKQVWQTKEEKGDKYRGHVELSCGDLAHSILIFDEAHMYSPYTWGLMHSLFEILYASKIPFILSTATMPDALKNGFEEGVLSSGFKFDEIKADFSSLPKREIIVEFIDEPIVKEDSQLNPRLLSELGNVDRALVVVNRVKKAQEVYKKIKEQFNDKKVILIHSRFTVGDRKRLEQEAQNMIGKNGTGGIVVSTQVLEAGLDISADLLITELAPADSLVQRSGRCARWGGTGRMLVFDSLEIGEDEELEEGEGEKSEESEKGDENEGKKSSKSKGEKEKKKQDKGTDTDIDKKEVLALPYRKEDLDKTREELRDYLMAGKTLDLGDWSSAKDFVKDMDYRPDHIASAQSAWTLLERSVLFADSKPRLEEISVREDSFVTIYLQKKEDGQVILDPDLSLTISIRIANKSQLKERLTNVEKKKP